MQNTIFFPKGYQKLSKEIALTINLIHCNKKRRYTLCFESMGQRNHDCLDGIFFLFLKIKGVATI
jgi:hypothetical protein